MSILAVFDLETLPNPRFPSGPEFVRVPGNYSKPGSIEAYKHDPANIAKEVQSRALKPTLGRIICIGISFVDTETMTATPVEVLFDVDEGALLDKLWALIAHRRVIWCAYNGLRFDMPYLAWRAMVLERFELAASVRPRRRYGDSQHTDPTLALSAWPYTSLGEACLSLGIGHPSSKGGSQVFDWFMRGDSSRIVSHCTDDVKACVAIVLSLLRADMLQL